MQKIDSAPNTQMLASEVIYYKHVSFVLPWLSLFLLIIGLKLPFLVFHPGLGSQIVEDAVEVIFGISFDAQPKSLPLGIVQMFTHGNWGVGFALFLFSIFFPICKLCLLLASTTRMFVILSQEFTSPTCWRIAIIWRVSWRILVRTTIQLLSKVPLGDTVRFIKKFVLIMIPRTRHEWLEALGPWSMADVFVVSLLILSMQTMEGGTHIDPGPGFWFFLGSVVFAVLAVGFAKLSEQVQMTVPTDLQRPRRRTRVLYFSPPLLLGSSLVLNSLADVAPVAVELVSIPSLTSPFSIEIRELPGKQSEWAKACGQLGNLTLFMAFCAVVLLWRAEFTKRVLRGI